MIKYPYFCGLKITKSCSLNPFSKYDIPYVGLKEGEHHFFYNIDDAFFELHENDSFKDVAIEVDLQFDKGNFFQLTFNVGGTIRTDCDRCTEEFDLELSDVHYILVKFNDGSLEPTEDDGEVVYIERNDSYINVAKLLYEFILLSVPMKKMHPDDADGNPGCEINYQAEEEDNEGEDKKIDPRWAALKGLNLD